ncbi:MAG TPA: hypothetical protein VHP38_09380 [Ruminiclostridium sp.]|nr:hypothetical protein [Ruminiclostridium sp.]
MKKHVIGGVLAVIALLIILIGGYLYRNNNFLLGKAELAAGDVMPSAIKLYNSSGEVNRISDVKSKYKVIFYLESTNEDCLKRLNGISKIISLLSYKDIRYQLVWEDRIPAEQLKESGIGISYNYSLEGKTVLDESKPTAYLLEEDNKIIMITGYSYISLINKIIELGGKRDFSTKAGEMILKDVSDSDQFHGQGAGKTLLMFMSSGCRLCRAGEEIIKKNTDSLQKKINVITIRPDFDEKQSFDKYYEVDPEQIYFNIFCYKLNIGASNRKYPMFIIINRDFTVDKLFTDPNEAVKYVSEM